MRIIEIDFLKGIAVILMIIFHFFYLGRQMNKLNINTSQGLLYIIAKIIQFIFITCMGVNYHYSFKKNKNYIKCLKRFTRLLLVSIFISVFTYHGFGYNLFIKFGIFHFNTICTLLLFFFCK